MIDDDEEWELPDVEGFLEDSDLFSNSKPSFRESPKARPQPARTGFYHRALLEDIRTRAYESYLQSALDSALSEELGKLQYNLDDLLSPFGGGFSKRGGQIQLMLKDAAGLNAVPGIVEKISFEMGYTSEMKPFEPGASAHGALQAICREASTRVEMKAEESAKKSQELALKRISNLPKPEVFDPSLIVSACGDLKMSGPSTLDEADLMWSELHAQAPWFQKASVEAWRAMKDRIKEGQGPCIPPLLLFGQPGTGKTTFARNLAAAMNSPLVEIEAGSGTAGFSVSGTEKGWSSVGPGLPVETILRQQCPNPVIVINEICRVGGGAIGTNGSRTSLSDALLPLLEKGTASAWRCPALRLRFDMSRIIWILTANNIDLVDPALLSRVRPVEIQRPTSDQVRQIVLRRLEDLDEELAEHAADLLSGEWKRRPGMTLRQIDEMIRRVRRTQDPDRPMLH